VSIDVSVVVPTRNRSALLSLALASVLRQRGVEIEVIVVDEASSDGTAEVLAAAAAGDARLRVVRHDTPRGVSAARNRGAAEARGEWVAFLDDDDLWAPDKLARQLDSARAALRHWAYTGSVNITNACRIIYGVPPMAPEEVVAALPHYNAVPGGGSNVVMRHRVWKEIGTFDTRLRNTEDWELWIRLARHGLPACVPLPLMAYRVHGENSSLNVSEIVRGVKLIEMQHQTQADWGRLHRWMAESYLRRGQRGAAVNQMMRAALRGEAAGVLADFLQALRRRLASAIPGAGSANTGAQAAWLATAAEWLREFEGCAEALSETPQASRAPARQPPRG
jgi:glycosyltransferase involved in cell wall biosynthesis